jgi:MFS transporter, DHA1 family, multidrug resistance protein
MLFVGSFLNGTAFPMIIGIAGCAAVALALAQTTLRSTRSISRYALSSDDGAPS